MWECLTLFRLKFFGMLSLFRDCSVAYTEGVLLNTGLQNNDEKQFSSSAFFRLDIASDIASFLQHPWHTWIASFFSPCHIFPPHIAFFSSYSSSNKPSSSKPFKKLFTAGIGGGGGEASWAVATARLYPIRTRSVEKGCGLEPVTSVPLPLPPRHSAEKGREKEAREGENTKEVLASQLAVCMISSSSSFHVRRVYPLFALQPSQKHILNLTGIFLWQPLWRYLLAT